MRVRWVDLQTFKHRNRHGARGLFGPRGGAARWLHRKRAPMCPACSADWRSAIGRLGEMSHERL